PFAGSSANSLSEPALEPYAKNLPPGATTLETGWTAVFVHDGAPMAKPPGTGLGAVEVGAETVDAVAVAPVVLGGAVLPRFRARSRLFPERPRKGHPVLGLGTRSWAGLGRARRADLLVVERMGRERSLDMVRPPFRYKA